MTDHIDALAAEIVTLINASPRTPRVDEISAIIARAAAPTAFAEDPLAQQWDRALAELHAGIDGPAQDGEVHELQERLAEATLAIWRRGARSVADLPLFARLAREWVCADFKASLVPSPEGLDGQSVAQLVNAVLRVTGANVQGEGADG